jgi:hypothetical protein
MLTKADAMQAEPGTSFRVSPRWVEPGGTCLGDRGALHGCEDATRGRDGLFLARRCASLAQGMPKHVKRSAQLILIDAQRALSMTQREFGYAVESSHRSAVRWASRQT